MARRPFTVGCLAGLVLAGAGCAAETNFSQRPVFHGNLACLRRGKSGCVLE